MVSNDCISCDAIWITTCISLLLSVYKSNQYVRSTRRLGCRSIYPEIISLKEILKKLLKLINKKRLLVPMPLFFAKISAHIFQIFPKPLLTVDQLKLLKYDNISSGNYKTNFDIGVPSVRFFDKEVEKYSYMWREGGKFSTEKYNSVD